MWLTIKKSSVIWDVTQCCPVEHHRLFRKTILPPYSGSKQVARQAKPTPWEPQVTQWLLLDLLNNSRNFTLSGVHWRGQFYTGIAVWLLCDILHPRVVCGQHFNHPMNYYEVLNRVLHVREIAVNYVGSLMLWGRLQSHLLADQRTAYMTWLKPTGSMGQ